MSIACVSMGLLSSLSSPAATITHQSRAKPANTCCRDTHNTHILLSTWRNSTDMCQKDPPGKPDNCILYNSNHRDLYILSDIDNYLDGFYNY